MKLFKLYNKEGDIVERCKKGERKAQQELFTKYSPLLMSVCMRIVAKREEAEEVLSSVFLKVFKSIGSLKEEVPLEAWMRRICINESLNHLRIKRSIFLELDSEDYSFEEYRSHNQEDPWATEELQRMIEKRPLGYRTVFTMVAIEGFSHQEVASLLNMEESSSRSQLVKARQLLQKQITERNYIVKHERATSI
jgi:RNA polymerase sigma factor (sigma-70 family)